MGKTRSQLWISQREIEFSTILRSCVWGRKEGANSYHNKPLWIGGPPNPVAYAHRQRSVALWAKARQPYARSAHHPPLLLFSSSPLLLLISSSLNLVFSSPLLCALCSSVFPCLPSERPFGTQPTPLLLFLHDRLAILVEFDVGHGGLVPGHMKQIRVDRIGLRLLNRSDRRCDLFEVP